MAIESRLKAETLAAITDYLIGRKSGPDVAEWAMSLLISEPYDDEPLLKEALWALSNLDHEDIRWDTPREELEYLRDCLIGSKQFVAPIVVEKGS